MDYQYVKSFKDLGYFRKWLDKGNPIANTIRVGGRIYNFDLKRQKHGEGLKPDGATKIRYYNKKTDTIISVLYTPESFNDGHVPRKIHHVEMEIDDESIVDRILGNEDLSEEKKNLALLGVLNVLSFIKSSSK